MSKVNISKTLKAVQATFVKRSPEILTGIGIAGMFTTVVLAVKATPKALRQIEDKKAETNVDKLTPVETVKTAWKPYIPAAVTGIVSTACIIGASSVNARRNAALATAYTLSEAALKEYQDKVVETIGEKKEQTIRDKVVKDKIDKDPVSTKEIILTEKGNTLCYDLLSGRYFKSDIEAIRKAENELNYRLMNEMYISLNEFYYELGLNPTKLGNELGWNVDEGLIDIEFSSQLSEDGTPCLALDYRIAPRYNYGKLM